MLGSTASHHHRLELLDAETVLGTPDLRVEWEEFVNQHPHVNGVYASPTWVGHLTATSDRPVRVCFARDERGRMVGAGAIRSRAYDLRFGVGRCLLLRRRVEAAELLGSLLILPEDPQVHADAISLILAGFAECAGLYIDALPTDEYLWRFLSKGHGLPRACYLHVVDGPRPWHLVQLAPSYEAYLQARSRRFRRNLRVALRQMDEALGSPPRLCRITAPGDVERFLEEAARVSRRSWQHRQLGQRVRTDEAACRSLQDLGSRGILRSYLLRCRDAPFAFGIGYQYSGVYHYAETGFDESFAQHSPGYALLCLMLEDLHTHEPARMLNFGIGDAEYKQRFGNCERNDVSCLVMRRRLGNVALTSGHLAFSRAIQTARGLAGRPSLS